MNINKEIDIRVKISTLWIVVIFNMVFADILSLYIPWIHEELASFAWDTSIALLMLIWAIVHQIPIFMIYFSRVLQYKINRLLNIIASIITIIYIVWGGSFMPHYIFIWTVEVLILLYIIFLSWKWKVIKY